MALKQENRWLAITTEAGPDVLAVKSITVHEQLSRLFEIEAELRSEDGSIEFDKVLGHNATVRMDLGENGKRFFNGFVSRFVQVTNRGGIAQYRATIVPWLWFLTRSSDCRIFQEMSVPEILEQVFQDHGFSDYALHLSETYEKREFCVQYRETAFNFVSRLMEQAGIYYFFAHENGSHKLVLADSPSAHAPIGGYEEVVFHEIERGGVQREEIVEWLMERQVQPVTYALNDFDFMKPQATLLSSSGVSRGHGAAQYEIYDYPGEYLELELGTRLADVRLAELQAQFEVFTGKAHARGLATGATFKLKNHPRPDHNREFLITGVNLHADAGEFASDGSSNKDDEFFSCSLTAIDTTQPFRAPRATPKPFVQGPQTAIVVGPSGEELHTDDQGRVKVQFHWDRYGKYDENSSCFIRVSQPNAGKGWGAMITPRIGQEVIVDFLEGDPDRPIITGRVYNGECAPPYGGGGGVVSGTKSKTHKGGGYNEMSMDDTAGKEKVTIHGQYDMGTKVGNNQTNDVGVDQSENIGSNRTTDIGANDKLTVGGNSDTSITGNRTIAITGKNETTISATNKVSVSGKEDYSIGAKSTLMVGASRMETIAASHTIMNAKMTVGVGSKYALSAGSGITELAPKVLINGTSKLQAISGGPLDVKASAKLTQQSGAAMQIKAGGALKAQSGSAMSLKSGAATSVQASAAMNLKAGGAITQKGASIKLNAPTKVKGTTLTVG